MNRSWVIPVSIIAVILVLAACCLLILGASTAFVLIRNVQDTSQITPTITPLVIRPTAPPTQSASNEDGQTGTPTTPSNTEALADPDTTLRILSEAEVPINDPADIARRLEGKENIPPTLAAPESPLQIGDQQEFWVTNADSNDTFKVNAILGYITEHSYFWLEDGIEYDKDELRDLAETFENQIYPTDREFFGTEWTPGVDSDPHLYILYTTGLGNGIAGYFSSNDSYNPLLQEYSNGHEMFVLNADNITLREEFTYGVLAHEFQHMIHWYRDRNETSWLNEGFSDLAMFLNGYDIGGHDYLYASNPDLQLNDWPNDPDKTSPHYGASFLFMTYFLDRFGEVATQALVADKLNGMESIDFVLQEIDAQDPISGKPIQADDVFMDWIIASYLQDGSVADGRYTYRKYANAPQPTESETIRNCDGSLRTRDVRQYGADYIRIKCSGSNLLHFEGSTQVSVLPAEAHSGRFAYWSNKGDESDMTLTQTFDFTDSSGALTLQYWTWYDIEEDYDYLYLEASVDGENWEILTTPSGTAEDPTGANYGWGYNGVSGSGPRWVFEEVDLSRFSGEKVQLRFEYITDAAVNGEGFLLDDIAIPEIGYASDFETDNGGWEANGWVRMDNVLPQKFRLAIISPGDQPAVTYVPLGSDNAIDIPINIGDGVDEVILIVTGTTRFTRQPAAYRFNFTP